MSRVATIVVLAILLAAAAQSQPVGSSQTVRSGSPTADPDETVSPRNVDPAKADPRKLNSGPRSGILVLKNGHILRGRITWSGDHYFVDREGMQLGVQTPEVECVAADLMDAYRQQRGKLADEDLAGRQTLAEWCLRYDLPDQAAVELALCRELQPHNLRTAELARRLALVPRHPATQAEAYQKKRRTDGERADAQGRPSSVRTTNVAEVFEQVPADAIEPFAKSIQPMLINNCASGGCHGTGSKSSLALTRFNPRKTSSRAYTGRNLEAVLKHVDRAMPDKSPLLVESRRAHGGAKTAAFHGRNLVQYQQLQHWVYRLAGQAAEPTAENETAAPRAGARPPSKKLPIGESAPTPATDRPSALPVDAKGFNERFFPGGPAGRRDAVEPAAADAGSPPLATTRRDGRGVVEDDIPPVDGVE